MLVKYFIPVLLMVIWIGGLYGLISQGSFEFVMILIVLGLILLISSLIFTVLPAKSEDWFKTGARIEK